jgi:hypothetical protein
MKNNTIISKILQGVINEEKVKKIAKKYKYEETARKADVSTVLRYQLAGSIEECESLRELPFYGIKHGLTKLDYSTLSKKGKEIPYEIALEVMEETMRKANRAKRRALTKEYNRFVRCFDTTVWVDTKNKWSWSPYRAGGNGIKAHISYQPSTGLPDKFSIGAIKIGDTAKLEEFCKNGQEADCVLADRGYLNVAKFCHLDDAGQDFVIRIPEKVNVVNPIPHDFTRDSKYTDVLCSLGKDHSIPAKYRKRQFRVISFAGDNAKTVTLCTNIYSLTADEIADLYRLRWQIEVFFKTLKQNFALKKIFGSTINSVFTQVIVNFIAYIVLFSVFSRNNFNFSFLAFLRFLRFDALTFSNSFFDFLNFL